MKGLSTLSSYLWSESEEGLALEKELELEQEKEVGAQWEAGQVPSTVLSLQLLQNQPDLRLWHTALLQFHSSLQPVKLLLPSLQGMLCSEEQAQQRRDELCPLCALFLPPWGQKV